MNAQKGLVSVIIINYKTPKLTIECVESILQFTHGVNFEIIVVDNGSGADSKEYFDQYMPKDDKVRLIYSPNNLGFGGGNNLGYANSRGDYLFFLNSDTVLFEDSLTALYQEYIQLSKTMKLGLLGPRLYLDYKRTNVQMTGTLAPSLFSVIIASIPYFRRIFIHDYQNFTLSDWDRNSDHCIGVVCGAAFLVHRDVRTELGFFDDRFFLYMEEFDLGMRIKKLGYHNFYTTITSIIHLENQSPKNSWKKIQISVKSLFKFIYKYLFNFHK